MAGAGFKTFNTGDVLTASDVNTYLMQQTVMVFASSAARTTALGANVAEGMLSYLKDTDQVEVYNGSAWVSSDDPNAIQNTIVDAKGDLISATAADTPARLAVGTNGQVLTADSSTATGLKWATPSVGLTQLASGSLSGSSVVLSSISGSYKDLRLELRDFYGSANATMNLKFNAITVYNAIRYTASNNTLTTDALNPNGVIPLGYNNMANSDSNSSATIFIFDYANSGTNKNWQAYVNYTNSSNNKDFMQFNGNAVMTAAVDSLTLAIGSGTFSAGTYVLYGVS